MEKEAGQSGIRINKYIASAGICSRREADSLIDKERVLINGRIAKAGDRVFPGDAVICNGKKLEGPDDKVVLAYYKPVGVICSEKDKHADRLVSDELSYKVRVTYAGRLDKDSEGLLLMTNDGDLIDKLMRGKARHEKEYKVKVAEEITEDFLSSLREGVYLEELSQKTRPCEVIREGKYTFSIILTQGLNRQIRRMCEANGFHVKALKRVRVANITLDKLRPGEYRKITGEEKETLYRIAFGKETEERS